MIEGKIVASDLVRFRVLKIRRFPKRVLIRTWVHMAPEPPVERWYRVHDTHLQNITFRIT